jgi:subtilisin family serine protease
VRTQRDPGWALDRIDQRQLPLDHRYRTRTRGHGVTVYVIDCGAQVGNEQFGGRAVRGPNIAGGRWTDCQDAMAVGHATFVSGIIGGLTTGVAQRARIVSVRTLKGGEGAPPPPAATELRRVVRAIDWVIDDAAGSDRPAVVNLSLSFEGKHPRLAAAMARLEDAGITAVVAAGNDGGNACRHVPANVSTALTVGAANRHDRGWAGSNVGRCVDVFAPGVGVRSVLRGGGAFTYRGSGATSWATPYVSGVAALYLSQHPRARPARVRRWVLAKATSGVLSGLPPSTANRLLFSFAPLS